MQLGQSAEAIRDFTAALNRVPDHLWALLGRGVALRMANDLEASLADFDRAVQIETGDTWVWAQRGETRRMLGEYEGAVADFNARRWTSIRKTAMRGIAGQRRFGN